MLHNQDQPQLGLTRAKFSGCRSCLCFTRHHNYSNVQYDAKNWEETNNNSQNSVAHPWHDGIIHCTGWNNAFWCNNGHLSWLHFELNFIQVESSGIETVSFSQRRKETVWGGLQRLFCPFYVWIWPAGLQGKSLDPDCEWNNSVRLCSWRHSAWLQNQTIFLPSWHS